MEKMLIRGLLINSFEENEEQKSRTDFLVYINSLLLLLQTYSSLMITLL